MDAAPGTPETLQNAIEFFSDSVNCHNFMVALRWPDGVVTCPTCGGTKVRYLANAARFECKTKHSKRQFTLKTGTIFEDSPLPLKSWVLAVWMIANCKNGISSYELARATGVTQKTAWFMLHRVRLAMQGEDGGQLGGEVEIDETLIGGRARNMHPGKWEKAKGRTFYGKTMVMGLIERHPEKGKSKVRTAVVPNHRLHQVRAVIDANVAKGSKIYTDELQSYYPLGYRSSTYQHSVINHAEAYVNGQVHTNGIENFWSLLKRAIKGTYVSIEPFHLFRYLDEQTFRFNERTGNDADRFCQTMRQAIGRRVTYEQLTGGPAEA